MHTSLRVWFSDAEVPVHYHFEVAMHSPSNDDIAIHSIDSYR